MKLRAAGYFRYSSDNQREESIENQIRVCRGAASKEGLEIADDALYIDMAQSGTRNGRESLDALLAAAERKEFDIIFVSDISRLSRNNTYSNFLLEKLEYYGVKLVAVNDSLDTRNKQAKLLFQVKSILNEQFIDDLRIRTKDGQLGQIEKGYLPGNPGYGYNTVKLPAKVNKRGKKQSAGSIAEIDPDAEIAIKRIYNDWVEGNSVASIVKGLNKDGVLSDKGTGWNESSVTRILKNEKFRGIFTWNKTKNVIDPGTGRKKPVPRPEKEWIRIEIPRIISDELWFAAQERWKEVSGMHPPGKGGKTQFAKGQKSYADKFPPHLLSKALRCSECGGSYVQVGGKKCKKTGKNLGYYGCDNAYKRNRCSNRVTIRRDKLEDHFVNHVFEHVLTPDTLIPIMEATARHLKEEFSHIPKQIEEKKKLLQRSEKALQNYKKYIRQGNMSETIVSGIDEEERQCFKLRRELDALEGASPDQIELPSADWFLDGLSSLKEILTSEVQKAGLILRKLFGPIVLTPTEPEGGGKSYLVAKTKVKTLSLFGNPDKSSNWLQTRPLFPLGALATFPARRSGHFSRSALWPRGLCSLLPADRGFTPSGSNWRIPSPFFCRFELGEAKFELTTRNVPGHPSA